MKMGRFTIFRKLAVIIFILLTVLGVLFILITYFATTYYHQASTQLLNKDVAAHISVFTSPFTNTGIDRKKADSVFQSAMVLSPAAEVYFLDTSGKVIYFHASDKDILQWHVDRETIEKYIYYKGEKYITAADPRDPAQNRIFSAASVEGKNGRLGYIYVILDSKKSEGIIELLRGNYIVSLAVKVFVIILLLTFLLSLLYLKRVGRGFRGMIHVLERFEAGDFDARFEIKKQDEMLPVKHAFNKMANLLSITINQLKGSEQERKNLIAGISHDLRTPLAIARGYTETLLMQNKKDHAVGDEKKQHAQLIYNKLLQLENMVNQLFELSKMEAVEFKPQIEPFVFSEIVEEAFNTHQLIAKAKRINLLCSGCKNTVWINADVSMIERVVQNLVDNALKNTPENGDVEISVLLKENMVNFTIANDGLPLSIPLLQWINDRLDKDLLPPPRPQKAGLGLVIVQKILNLHGTFLSAAVVGSRNVFTFRFPVYNNTY